MDNPSKNDILDALGGEKLMGSQELLAKASKTGKGKGKKANNKGNAVRSVQSQISSAPVALDMTETNSDSSESVGVMVVD